MPIEVGKIAPDFELPDYQENFHSLSGTGGNKLLVFYKTTCPACQLTLPLVDRLYSLYGNAVSLLSGVRKLLICKGAHKRAKRKACKNYRVATGGHVCRQTSPRIKTRLSI